MHVLDYDSLRLGTFLVLFLSFASLESFLPRRSPTNRGSRWRTNLSLTGINAVLARFTLGTIPLLASHAALEHQWGLLHQLAFPSQAQILVSFLALDLAIYFQHWIFHATPLLWRLHKIHHSDSELDVTTGFRFHPLEILLSLAIKIAVVLLLGIHPWGVMTFEVALSSASLFNHANIRIHPRLESGLRIVLITPDLHAIHHSQRLEETNSNFGFTTNLWDKIFGTLCGSPQGGNSQLRIGLEEYCDSPSMRLKKLLKLPFVT